MPTITKLKARLVFDSRGMPTVEAEVCLDNGGRGRFITPSGASCGSKEVVELRDKNRPDFFGKGVSGALANIADKIHPAIINKNFADQHELDALLLDLDGTANKSVLGANAILPVSAAFFRAQATGQNRPLYDCLAKKTATLLPMPLVNVINGGAHANNSLNIQEFMLVPKGAQSFHQALKFVAETFYALKDLLLEAGQSIAVGDEGGFAPRLSSNEDALDWLCWAVEKAGLRLGEDIWFALDMAASEFYNKKSQKYDFCRTEKDASEMLVWYENIIKKYPICSIEDPFFEEDFLGFSEMTKKMGVKIQIVGDDLFVTNERLIREGADKKWANAVLIKMNQIGTISETLASIKAAQELGLGVIISHRSGDSEDTTIADLAVLTSAGQIKTGSMSRSERVAKYNRLLRIEEELGSRAKFNGESSEAKK